MTIRKRNKSLKELEKETIIAAVLRWEQNAKQILTQKQASKRRKLQQIWFVFF